MFSAFLKRSSDFFGFGFSKRKKTLRTHRDLEIGEAKFLFWDDARLTILAW